MVTCFRGVLQPIPAGYSIVAVKTLADGLSVYNRLLFQ